MQKLSRLVCFAALAFAACSSVIAPTDIESGDMCSFCRMAISEKQYAAEIVDTDENVFKFDDIGCMLRYLKARGATPKEEVVFVMDSQSKRWLKAEEAFFVRSKTVKTPMGSGIVAFSSAESAGSGSIEFEELQNR
jgi:copper chaperone NosL